VQVDQFTKEALLHGEFPARELTLEEIINCGLATAAQTGQSVM
jgi:hypothetical protein